MSVQLRCATFTQISRRIWLGAAFATAAFAAKAAEPPSGALASGLANALDTDHLAFVLGAGLISAMIGRPAFAPIAFVAAAAAGALAHRMGLQLVAVDPACAIMAAFAGVLLLIRGPSAPRAALVLFGFAGLFHGWRLATPALDATAGGFAGHVGGVALAQYALTAGVALIAAAVPAGAPLRVSQRMAGGALAFFGATRAALSAGFGG